MCADDPEYRHYTDIKQLPPHRLAEIRRFFEDCILNFNIRFFLRTNYSNQTFDFGTRVYFFDNILDKKNENKEVAVNDFLPAETAMETIQYSM